MTLTKWKHHFAALLLLAIGALPLGAAQATDVVTYYHTDGLGTTVMESNAGGQVTYSREHRPYGEQVLGAAKNGPGFTGHVGDADTGLTYMQQRYYDPAIGRFLSVDPVTANPNNGGNFNRYWYANNNPYKFIDPDGRVAIVTRMKDGSIQVDLPSKFSGTAASEKNISAVKSQVGALSGTYKVGGKDTQVNFRVTEITKDTPRAARNSITLTEGPTERSNGRSGAEIGGKKAWIDVTDRPVRNGTSAHEFLHLADNNDRYNTATGMPDPAKGNNIMNIVPGVPDSTNIQEIMDSRKNIFRTEGN